MDIATTQQALLALLPRFAINVAGVTLLVLALYHPRHHDKDLVTTAMMFNLAVFAVLTMLAEVDFGLAAGFGLFAVLALFRLRSEQFSKVDMSYFFGAVAVGVICSIQGTTLAVVLAMVLLILLGAWVLDHPRLLKATSNLRVTLDRIDPHALSDRTLMCSVLGKQLGVNVVFYEVRALDYVRDKADLNVYYRK